MSTKSIILSIIALLLSVGIIVAIVFMFKLHFILGIVGIALLFIPLKIQQKALNEASGTFDKVFAKYIVPVLLLIAIVFIVLMFTLWLK